MPDTKASEIVEIETSPPEFHPVCIRCDAPFDILASLGGTKATCPNCSYKLRLVDIINMLATVVRAVAPISEHVRGRSEVSAYRKIAKPRNAPNQCSHCGEILRANARWCPNCQMQQTGA